MKKNKRNWNRQRPRGPTPNEVLAAAKARRAKLRWVILLGGFAVVLLVGFLMFQHFRPAASPVSRGAGSTNNPRTALNDQHGVDGGATSHASATNRAGAAKNREAEGGADDLNNQAARLLAGGDVQKAVELFKQAVALNPDDETFHFNLGIALARLGDVTNAEHEYKEALRLLPDYPEAHHNYGNLLFRAGRMTEAEEHLAEAVNQLPESPAFNNSLGVLQVRLKKTNEALLSFQKAVECDSNFAEAHFNLALSYLARKDRERGVAELRQTLKLKPGFEPAEKAMAQVTSMP
jgi:Flp pilus assembly protein TadD